MNIRQSLFERNVSAELAAAVGVSLGIIEDCVFIENSGFGSGGAVKIAGTTVRRCLFDGNSVFGSGGAIFASGFGNVIENNTIVRSHKNKIDGIADGAAIRVVGSNLTTLYNNIIAFSSGSVALHQQSSNVGAGCNVFFGNEAGDAVGYNLRPTDRVIDPQFCDPDMEDWTLRTGSPCLPEDPLGCGLIGAFDQGCGPISVEPQSWGHIKAGFREERK